MRKYISDIVETEQKSNGMKIKVYKGYNKSKGK